MSVEEVRMTSETGGSKGVKEARYDLLPAGPLNTVATLYGRGAKKYAENNWRLGYPWAYSFAALQRHAWGFWNGEDVDEETGLPHMASVVFHAFTLLEFMETHRRFDNRPKRQLEAAPLEAMEDGVRALTNLAGVNWPDFYDKTCVPVYPGDTISAYGNLYAARTVETLEDGRPALQVEAPDGFQTWFLPHEVELVAHGAQEADAA